MTEEANKTSEVFQVFCIWCGVRIRPSDDEDSFGTCLRCFYRMVSEKLASQMATDAESVFASDR